MFFNGIKKISYTVRGSSLLFTLSLFFGCANTFSALPENAESSVSLFSPITLYQKYISPIDGNRCPMHPSCSAYCSQAMGKHGFFMGWIMTCDRLLRCGRDELKLSPRMRIGNEVYSSDPVNSNDFWW